VLDDVVALTGTVSERPMFEFAARLRGLKKIGSLWRIDLEDLQL
jgi:hypothetical protein